MNFEIDYVIEYAYSGRVTDNLNTLRVRPANTDTQRCDDFQLRIDPSPRVKRRVDYFGTDVLEFGVTTPHQRLRIDVRARVTTSEPDAPLDGSWTMMRGDAYQSEASEFVLANADDPPDELLGDLIEAARRETPRETAERLHELIFERFEYRPGATYVGSTIADLLSAGAGVCQDFAHLSLLLLRRHGIAARYVSGYLFSTAALGENEVPSDAGTISAEVQTHAWVEALLPGGDGGDDPRWVGVDPTNRQLADAAYVKIGHGRDYSDVAPTRGVYFGAATADLTAHVTMTRNDPAIA